MQGNEELKKRQILSAQIDLSKFNKGDFIKATEEEKKQQDVMGESTTFFKDGMKRLKKNPLAMGSIVILVLILALIIIAPFFVPYSYSDIITVDGKRDKTAANMAPFEYSKLEQQYMDRTGEKLFPHIFGTDNLSRDYFIRVIYGTRVSLSVGDRCNHGTYHWTGLWFGCGIFWWKSGSDHDAYRGYCVFLAGYAHYHSAFGCVSGTVKATD